MDKISQIRRISWLVLFLAAFTRISVLADDVPAVNPPGPPSAYTYRASVYFDWFGTAYEQGGGFLNQVGTRLKFELTNGAARDWTLLIDVRDRLNLAAGGSNQVLLYNVRFTYDSPRSPIFVSVGQMNLYDTAGIGQLLGAVGGFKWKSALLLGGYAGLERDVYARKFETGYFKYGAFAKYTGPKALSLSLSFNQLRYSGTVERTYLYAQALVPVQKTLYIYGNMEYELGKTVKPEDRLSRLFLNARLDLTRYADVTGFYSSGRGLDFHSYVLEHSQNPSLQDRGLERFFYSEQYGARVAIKPVPYVRLYVSRQESRQKDLDISNHTWRLGASATDIMKTGLSAYGDYSFNRGSRSESDSYYLSLSREFGKVSAYVSFANTYNGLRILPSGGEPQIIHLDGYKTISADVFVPLSRRITFSAEYSYFLQRNANEHQFFIRLIFRK
jgi:hypothetical protein